MPNENPSETDRQSAVPCSALFGAWVDAKAEQPPEWESVLVWGRLDNQKWGWHEGFWGDGEWSPVRYKNTDFDEVSHWMRGPDAPNDEASNGAPKN